MPHHRPSVATEHDEQAALFRWADLMAARHAELATLFAIPNFAGHHGGALARMRSGARSKAEGRKKGVPDVFLPVPRGGHHGLFLELKRVKGGSVKPEQREWHAVLQIYGYRVGVCRGWEAARDAITEYLNLPRAA